MNKATNRDKGVALVIGAGDATGGAIAKRFAREGYFACVTRRSADKQAQHLFACGRHHRNGIIGTSDHAAR